MRQFGPKDLNVHFHVLMIDGLYVRDRDRLIFRRAPRLSTRNVEHLVVDVATRAERWLAEQNTDFDDSDAALPEMQPASIQGRSAVTGKRARRVQQLGGREFELPPRCASFEGYNLHGNTAVAAKDRAGLDKRCRYVLRPPLAALVPPPRVNTVLYHGVLAARANDRQRLLPRPTPLRQRARVRLTRVEGPIESRWTPWVELLRRVFGVDGLACPQCGQAMTLRTVVVRPPATTKVLAGPRPRGPP